MASKKSQRKESVFVDAKVANCQRLNIRKNPTMDSEIVTTLKTGTIVQKGPEQNGWAEVKLRNSLEVVYALTEYVVPLKH